MPYRRLPNTISAVLRTLTTARDAWKQFPDARLEAFSSGNQQKVRTYPGSALI